MPTKAPPDGYLELSGGAARGLVRADVREALGDLDIADLAALREGAETNGRAGRAGIATRTLRDGRRVIIKESRRGGLLGRLLGDLYFGDARFHEEVRLTVEAARRGIRVAAILASVVRPASLGFCRHHFIIEEIPDARDLREVLVSSPPGPEGGHRRRLEALARAVRALHDAGIPHADFSLGNILLSGEGAGETGGVGETPQVAFIDFDTTRLAPRLDLEERCRNLVRLYRSFLKAAHPPGRREQVRFVRTYFGKDRDERRRAWAIFRRAGAGLALHRLAWKLGIR